MPNGLLYFYKNPSKLFTYSTLPIDLAIAPKYKTKRALSKLVGLAANSKVDLKWLPQGLVDTTHPKS